MLFNSSLSRLFLYLHLTLFSFCFSSLPILHFSSWYLCIITLDSFLYFRFLFWFFPFSLFLLPLFFFSSLYLYLLFLYYLLCLSWFPSFPYVCILCPCFSILRISFLFTFLTLLTSFFLLFLSMSFSLFNTLQTSYSTVIIHTYHVFTSFLPYTPYLYLLISHFLFFSILKFFFKLSSYLLILIFHSLSYFFPLCPVFTFFWFWFHIFHVLCHFLHSFFPFMTLHFNLFLVISLPSPFLSLLPFSLCFFFHLSLLFIHFHFISLMCSCVPFFPLISHGLLFFIFSMWYFFIPLFTKKYLSYIASYSTPLCILVHITSFHPWFVHFLLLPFISILLVL